MNHQTEASKQGHREIDDIFDAIAKRNATAFGNAAITTLASKTRIQVGDYEDYYSQGHNVPAGYEDEFFPIHGR